MTDLYYKRMHLTVRTLLGSMAVGGVAGLGHGLNRGAPVKDTFIGATAPIWTPVMIVGISVRAAYLSCPHLNPNKQKCE